MKRLIRNKMFMVVMMTALILGVGVSGVGVNAAQATPTWSLVTGSLPYTIALYPYNGVLYAGTAYSGVWSWNGSTWSQLGSFPVDNQIISIAAYNSTVYAGTQGKGLYKWNGSSWSKITGITAQDINCLLIKGTMLWAGTSNGLWYLNLNNSSCASFFPGQNITAICANTGSLYAGTDQGVLYDDLLTKCPSGPWGTTKISSIVLDPNLSANPIVGTYGDGVWQNFYSLSNEYGNPPLTDSSYANGLAAYVNCLTWFNNAIYAGTGVGVWSAANNSSSWAKQGSISCAFSLATMNGTLYAGNDAGLWQFSE